ncbi:MAG: nicotinamide riboside transporter PnuC [Bacteroidetes bacterium]|nr:nicotinamide riboside transporter PnuC [Bacteroidota bacterium]
MDNWLEYAGVFFGIIYVLLASRSNIWCWLAGIISSAIYIYINVTHQLFQDAILQTYYVVAGFYGWWLWSSPSQTFPQGEGLNAKTNSGVISFSLQQNAKLIFFGSLLVPVFGFVFSKLGNSLSYFDSTVTIFSFIATWMTAKKILENWLFWIVIDLVAAVMYYIKHLELTSALYVFFALIAIYGYFEWKKTLAK